MRATVDDRALVGLTGADPVRANRVAWILGTELAAIGGILIAPTVALDAMQLSLLIVSAYTAAIFGRLQEPADDLRRRDRGRVAWRATWPATCRRTPTCRVCGWPRRRCCCSWRCCSSRTGGCVAGTGG